ncbi:hypothetical protein GCM10007972_15730 [Iodidimonas muriae]|uniref:Helix-turn-helix domain-containing protein n=2 Tax=Iodidimonas TaxID=2066486 RepID=A0ABQ2LDC9_9PROT|nr:helix-turn-helix domain-containing protein [Iodidimonas muriae]GER07968.1 hypothetical protein JCM17843_22780 [Kordiimonadales bacterium JCM 17843]GGO11713.1 hypothetical protein GCM10007972_15730 [Iodidimonas muriae]
MPDQSIAAARRDYLYQLINEYEAADYIRHSVRALRNWRVRGGGPRFVKISGRSIRYRRLDLDQWIESKLVASTSEVANDN